MCETHVLREVVPKPRGPPLDLNLDFGTVTVTPHMGPAFPLLNWQPDKLQK